MARASRKDPAVWLAIAGIAALWIIGFCMNPGGSGTTILGIPLLACPLRSLTGIRCPFCGMTTGCCWVAHGNLTAAWESNILSPWLMLGTLIALAYLALVRLSAGFKITLELDASHVRLLRLAGIGCLAVSWLVNLSRG